MKAIVETAANLSSRPTSVTSTCNTKFGFPLAQDPSVGTGRPHGHRRQEVDVHVGCRRAEAVLVIARVIGQTPGADVDEDRDQAALQCTPDIRDLGSDIHLNHEVTVGRRHVACPELFEEVPALSDHLVVQLGQFRVRELRHGAINIPSPKAPLIRPDWLGVTALGRQSSNVASRVSPGCDRDAGGATTCTGCQLPRT